VIEQLFQSSEPIFKEWGEWQ